MPRMNRTGWFRGYACMRWIICEWPGLSADGLGLPMALNSTEFERLIAREDGYART